MKKVIVTGAAGFIGRHLVLELEKQGVEVIALIRPGSENRSASCSVACGLSDYDKLPEMICDRDIDTVYHLAWQGVSDGDARDEDVQLANIKATLDLVQSAARMGISGFIGAGSLHEAEAVQEMSEDKVISNLGFMYKSAKTCAHFMAKAKAGALSLRFFWPVITNTYGEGEHSGRLINTVILSVMAGISPDLSEGKQLYDFVHISDVARAFYLIGEKGIDGVNYNIGSGTAKQLREYLSLTREIANTVKGGPQVSLNFGAIQSNVIFLPERAFSIETLVRDTGYHPQVSFDAGIKRTVEWIKTNQQG